VVTSQGNLTTFYPVVLELGARMRVIEAFNPCARAPIAAASS
jgi:hypothetical protein